MLILGAGAAVVYDLHAHKKAIGNSHVSVAELAKTNGQEPILTLTSAQRQNIPWERNLGSLKEPKNWEMRKVKVQGALLGNFHLVARQRNGQPGYLVFKAMKTANSLIGGKYLEEGPVGKGQPVGMMVNLGWVSHDNVQKLPSAEVDYISKVEHDTSLPALFPQMQDPYTGFVYNSEGDDFEFPIEGYNENEVVITGFLRKGEEPNRWLGMQRFPHEQVSTFIDLKRMAAFYMFDNYNSASNYYLEAAAQNSGETTGILTPASLDNPVEAARLNKNTKLHNLYSASEKLAALLTAVGVIVA